MSVVLSGILIFAVYRMYGVYEDGLAEQVTHIDIYADSIRYRTTTYPTASLLAIGLKAAQDPPRRLALHDCERMDVFEAVLDVLREQGYLDIAIDMPDDC